MFRSHKFIPYFQEKGLGIQDIPKAIVCHEMMGYVMLGLTWTACYHFPISDIPFLKGPMDRLTSMVPQVLSNPVNNNPFLCSKFGKAYMESACLRKLIRPITLPGKLFLTYKMVQIMPDIGLPTFCLPPKLTDCTAYKKVHGDKESACYIEEDATDDCTAIKVATPTGLSSTRITIDDHYTSYRDDNKCSHGLSTTFHNDNYVKFSDSDGRYKPLGLKGNTLFVEHMSRL